MCKALQLGRPVLDRTGLTGGYGLHMEFAPEAPGAQTGRGSRQRADWSELHELGARWRE